MVESKIWDFIIVGTGLGGGPIGLKLAQAGCSVLFLEKGLPPTLRGQFAEQFPGDVKSNLKNAGRMAEPIYDCTKARKKTVWPFMGSGVGGSSALYGMVLERFQESDFRTWPISYQAMEKYYAEAEKLFGVHTASSFSHPGNQELEKHFQSLRIRTYPLPLAHQQNPNCGNCQSYQCDQNCKNHSGNICIDVAVQKHGANLLTECEVQTITRSSDDRVSGVVARYENRQLILQAKNVILAAGALRTPLLLLDSELGNQSGLVGHNLMRHFVDLYALKIDRHPEIAMTKEIGVSLSPNFALQSFGRLPPLQVIVDQLVRDNPILRFVRPFLKLFLGPATSGRLVLATILPDEPRFENRVWKENGDICISYQIDSNAKSMIAASRTAVKKTVSKLSLMLIQAAEKNEMLAHVCGTTKMGTDPRTSVVDIHNKVHGIQNLYIADASFFPSSGSTNPGLTIAANSLRMAEHILSERSKL